MTNIKISIITPTYNSERTITRTIESILKQTYDNIEYIIVDGGSTDGTLQIISGYKDKFKAKGYCFKYISEPDEGIADAFNKGVGMCKGDVVGIVNSDDWLELNSLQVIAVNYNESYSIYCGDLRLYNNGKFIKIRKSRPLLLWLGMYIMHPTVFVEKKVYKQYRFDNNLKISMDWDFILKAKRKGRYKIKRIPLVLSNMELGGISSDLNKMRIEEMVVLKNNSSWIQTKCAVSIKKLIQLYLKVNGC